MKQFHICSGTLHSLTKTFITELPKQFQYKSIKLDLNEKTFYFLSLSKHYTRNKTALNINSQINTI